MDAVRDRIGGRVALITQGRLAFELVGDAAARGEEKAAASACGIADRDAQDRRAGVGGCVGDRLVQGRVERGPDHVVDDIVGGVIGAGGFAKGSAVCVEREGSAIVLEMDGGLKIKERFERGAERFGGDGVPAAEAGAQDFDRFGERTVADARGGGEVVGRSGPEERCECGERGERAGFGLDDLLEESLDRGPGVCGRAARCWKRLGEARGLREAAAFEQHEDEDAERQTENVPEEDPARVRRACESGAEVWILGMAQKFIAEDAGHGDDGVAKAPDIGFRALNSDGKGAGGSGRSRSRGLAGDGCRLATLGDGLVRHASVRRSSRGGSLDEMARARRRWATLK